MRAGTFREIEPDSRSAAEIANPFLVMPPNWAGRQVAGTFAVAAKRVKDEPAFLWTNRHSDAAECPAYTPAVFPRYAVPGLVVLISALAATGLAGCSSAPTTTPPVSPGTTGRPRDVNIVARDDVFSPPIVDLVPGETVVFHVINGGLESHEAIIGDQRVQDAWELAEANVPATRPGVTPAVSVPPGLAGLRIWVRSGERVDVVWAVPADPAQVSGLIVGCHVPGHYAKGMHVPVRIATQGGRGIHDPAAG